MAATPDHLAIEAAGRTASVALGVGGEVVLERPLERNRRHHVGIAAGIDTICREAGVSFADLRLVSVSLGPGSFTGLRIALAAVQMLAFAAGAKGQELRVVGVPTLEVVAEHLFVSGAVRAGERLAVGLAHKRGRWWSGVYERANAADVKPARALPPGNVKPAMVSPPEGVVAGDTGPGGRAALPSRASHGEPVRIAGAGLRTLRELFDAGGGTATEVAAPVGIALGLAQIQALGNVLAGVAGLRLLGGEAVEPRVASVLRLGWARAERGAFDDPAALVPIYAREPEAVTLWEERAEESGSPEVQKS